MSKLKALVTVLALGSSSLAAADTGLSFHAEAGASWGMYAPTIRDHRTTIAAYQPSATMYQPTPMYPHPSAPFERGTWISLAQPMSGQAVVRLDSRASFNQIRIQSAAGASYISTVSIRFADGTQRVLEINRTVDRRSPLLQFNVNRSSRIASIVIDGQAHDRRSSYQVFGYGNLETTRPMPPASEPPAVQPPVAVPPVALPPIYQPPVAQPPVAQPPVAQPPVAQPPVAQPQGVMLANTISFAHTDGRRLIDVGASKGPFSTVRFTGVTGSVYLKMIHVTFTNGQDQMLGAVNTTLRAGQVFDLKLDGAGTNRIQRISLWTSVDEQPITQATGELTATAF